MADDTKLRGFDIIADTLLKPGSGVPVSPDLEDDSAPIIDPEIVKKGGLTDDNDNDDDDKDLDKDDNKDQDDDKNDDKDLDDVDDDQDDKDDNDDSDDSDDDSDDLDETKEFETEVTKFFQKKIHEELGWEFDEEEAIDSVEDMINYMEELVTNASKPQYANDEVGKIDEFVKNGGRLEDYYKTVEVGGLDLDNIDITKESNQRRVVEEHLKTLGYDSERIKRVADRHEDRGILEEEAEDALELLKEYKEKETEKLLETQKRNVELVQIEQQKFVSNVEEHINNISDIAGYKLTAKEKRELSDYIFKPTKDGRTQYQIDYVDDQEKNLIESAFFTKNKEKLVSNAKQQASTDTLKDMQQRLKSSKGKRAKSSGSQQGGGKGSVQLASLGKSLMGQ